MSLRERLTAPLRPRQPKQPDSLFPLVRPLPLPDGVSEERLRAFLESVCVGDAPPEEMKSYCRSDFRRFVYTWGLLRDLQGRCLELGANPYFTTLLLERFTKLELTLANYFAEGAPPRCEQEIAYVDFDSGERRTERLAFHHFNIESGRFPFDDATFDAVLFGEIYDPCSGYGPYGRHNREYTRHDLAVLLGYLGFDLVDMFTADVHPNAAATFCALDRLEPLVRFRKLDLGQYIFARAVSARPAGPHRPSLLYRSYPPGELE